MRPPRSTTRPPVRRVLALAVLGALLLAALAGRSALDVEWSVEGVRGLVQRLGVWGPIGFVLLVGLRTPLLLPSQLLLTAAGICFGTPLGTLYGGAGLLLSGILAFGFTRWLGAQELRRRVPAGFRRTLEAAGNRGGAVVLALASGYPVGPITLLHATAGLTSMGVATFVAAAGAGGLARAATYAYFGSNLTEGRWLQAALAVGVLGLSLLPLLHPRVRAWVRRQFEADPPTP